MELIGLLVVLLLCLAASFVYAGAETGFYTLARAQVELDAARGTRPARWVRWLLKDESALLVTLLVGNNLALELLSGVGDSLLDGFALPAALRATAVTLLMTPIVFLLGEALPKDLFHRRPLALTYLVAGIVVASRIAYWPLERLLRGSTWLLERLLGVGPGGGAARPGRERLLSLLEEGARQGALPERARRLAENALGLGSTPISHCMTPWSQVLSLKRTAEEAQLRRETEGSRWTRLPVVDEGGAFVGYVHQLEVLAAGGEQPVLAHLRPLPVLPADTPADRALSRLRGAGVRAAVVGSAERPEGLVTLKDLVEEITGDLSGISG